MTCEVCGVPVMYVLYKDPPGFPGCVLKRWRFMPDGSARYDKHAKPPLLGSIDALRKRMRDAGLQVIARDPDDHPTIVETWH